MASLAQYQSFALIAYSAIKMQTLNVNGQLAQGCADDGCTKALYLAKNVNDVVFNYSMGCQGGSSVTETNILTMCDWLQRILKFVLKTPISELDETFQ